ncbi:LemA family protein [Patescibacteria group bacterium]|nr:LemA family protein [Patescibacteria group bacterium]MBU1673007.1 LemA family protein [Patescibacteria group bacterium]MBU1964166.1 LemA family protein [Patescibacteria group bacterium]
MFIALLVIGGIIVIVAIWLIAVYNGLIKLKNQVDEGWSDIDVQLKRRHDLIPNLVETVKGYAKHERELFENVTKARTAAMAAKAPAEMAKSENMLTGALKSLFAVAENYPDLKANQNFLKLQDELTDTENKIQAARRFYNGVVRDFNIKIQVFPNNIVAGVLGFKKRDFFEVEDAKERENVEVKF